MRFWQMIGLDSSLGPEFHGTYDPLLVVLSIVVASFAAYTALSVVDRIVISGKNAGKWLWHALGAFAMGTGIWAMHFTAMLALSLPVAVTYDPLQTAFSVLPGIIGAGFAIAFMARRRIGWKQIQLGGLLLALGIGTMHYTGMDAMRMTGSMRYDPVLFVLSIVVAHVLASIALYLKFKIARHAATKWWIKPRGGLAIGCTISAMHYTAMTATHYYATPGATVPTVALPPTVLAIAICALVGFFIGLTLIGTIVDRRFTNVSEFSFELNRRVEQRTKELKAAHEAAVAATETQRDTAEQLSRVLNTAPNGIVTIDSSGIMLSVNPAMENIFGFTRQEMIGHDVTLLMASPSQEKHSTGLERCLQTGRSGILGSNVEVEGVRRDGTAVPLFLAISKFMHHGQTFFTGILQDISERKAMQIQLFQAQKLESIGQLAAGIAHEINTPIQYVGDNTQFLQNAFADISRVMEIFEDVLSAAKNGAVPSDVISEAEQIIEEADTEYLAEEIPKAIVQSLEGVDRVSKIVMAMKAFSHPGTENKSTANLNQAIENTVTISSSEWKYAAELKMDLDPTLPAVPCLVGEMNQVFLNLIVNAAHAIEAALKDAAKSKGTITIRTRQDGNAVEIRIGDSGTGIPEAARARVFDPFFTTKEVGKGSGQGLAIAHSVVVDKHDGTIEFETETGKGTTFVIRLPLCVEPAETKETEPSRSVETPA